MSRMRFYSIVSIFLLLAVALSACGGAEFIPSGWPGLTIDQDTAYIAFNQYIFAIQADNGTQIWRHPQGDPEKDKTFYATPALTGDGQVIIGGYNKRLYSLKASDGSENWMYEAKDRFIASPVVYGDLILAPNADGRLYALDLQGNFVWDFNAKNPLWASPIVDEQLENVYLPTMTHELYSLDFKTGKLKWGPIELESAIVGKPALSGDGNLYIGTFGSELIAVNAENGDIAWRVSTDGWIWGGPAVHEDRLYFGDIDGSFYILNTSDHRFVKKYKPDGPITSTPLITEQGVYFATESGTIYAIDFDGNPLWNLAVGGKIHTAPVLIGDLILVAPMQVDQILVAVDLNGSQKWNFIPPK